MATAASDRFETVAWIYSPSDLALILSRFIEADIFVHRGSIGHIAADPGLTTALGGVALQVREADVVSARALLAGLEPRLYRARLFSGVLLVFLVMAFLGVGPPPRQVPTFVTGDAALRLDD